MPGCVPAPTSHPCRVPAPLACFTRTERSRSTRRGTHTLRARSAPSPSSPSPAANECPSRPEAGQPQLYTSPSSAQGDLGGGGGMECNGAEGQKRGGGSEARRATGGGASAAWSNLRVKPSDGAGAGAHIQGSVVSCAAGDSPLPPLRASEAPCQAACCPATCPLPTCQRAGVAPACCHLHHALRQALDSARRCRHLRPAALRGRSAAGVQSEAPAPTLLKEGI